jgi:hypothetical protein
MMAGMPQTNVIQGCFPNGLPRFDTIRTVAQPAMARGSFAPHVQRALAVHAPVQRMQAPLPPPVTHAAHRDAVQLPVQLAAALPRAAGQPLPLNVRQKMETVFGKSFADVRVHVGPQAASVGAHAFTQGTNVYFAPGRYQPHTTHGQRLLAHELTHVVQQREDRVRNPFGSGIAVVRNAALEAEAERMSLQAGTIQPFRGHVIQPGRGPNRAAARSKANRTRVAKHKAKKFVVTMDKFGNYVASGRPAFATAAKKIKVKVGSEDRRHIIPYHRLRDVITTAATKLRLARGEGAVTTRVTELIRSSGSRARTYDVGSLIKIANSNPKNLFPENAAENQGIEKLRSAAKRAWRDVATLYEAETAVDLQTVKTRAKSHFQFVGTTPITRHMAWISDVANMMIDFAAGAEGVFDALRWIERSTELDLNKKAGAKRQTEAVLALNNRMNQFLLTDDAPGEDGFALIEAFFNLPSM